jgi:uncharacterized protein
MKTQIYGIAMISLLLVMCACNTGKVHNPNNDALLRAAAAGNGDTVKSLLTATDIDVNVRDETGATPLILAARNGHDGVVKTLLIARAEINAKDNQGKTAMMYASTGGHDDTVRALVQAGAGK